MWQVVGASLPLLRDQGSARTRALLLVLSEPGLPLPAGLSREPLAVPDSLWVESAGLGAANSSSRRDWGRLRGRGLWVEDLIGGLGVVGLELPVLRAWETTGIAVRGVAVGCKHGLQTPERHLSSASCRKSRGHLCSSTKIVSTQKGNARPTLATSIFFS